MWNCPKCNESLEDNSDRCWKCASGRGGEAAPPGMVKESPAPTGVPPKTNWPLFFAILLAPAVLTFLRVANHGHPMEDWLLPPVVLFGSVASGIGCAILGEPRTSEMSGARRILWIVFWSVILIGFSLMFCFVGCSLG